MRISRTRASLLGVFACLTLACKGDGPTAPVHPYDGTWVGQTGEGLRVELLVASSAVVRFEMEVFIDRVGGGTCALFVMNNGGQPLLAAAPITNDTFSFEFSTRFEDSESTTISGRFDSKTRLSGTHTPFTFTFPGFRDDCAVSAKPAGTFFAEQ